MRTSAYLSLCMITALGCNAFSDWEPVNIHEQSIDGGSCPKLPDMLAATPPCAAAKGLSGDNLICVDFASISDQSLGASPPTKLGGWDFVTNCGGMNWEIAAGKLQIKNFDQFASTCGLTLPALNLNDADKQKYSGLTLSLIQRVDINNTQQTIQASLGSPVAVRTFWTTTGKTERQQLMIGMTRTDPVPVAASGVYQYLLQLTSGGKFPLGGWQIESIAVNGNM